MTEEERGRLFVISGIRAAGKTTVGMALAKTLSKAVFIDGETMADLVISGKELMTSPPSQTAVEQLLFRYVGELVLADTYRTGGFDAVIADNVIGEYLDDFLELASPETIYLVMLTPSRDTVLLREMERGKGAYLGGFTVDGQWETLQRQTQRVGLWLDNSHLTVAETVLEVLKRQSEAVVTAAVEPPVAD